MEIGVIEAQTAMQDEARPARTDAAIDRLVPLMRAWDIDDFLSIGDHNRIQCYL